MINFRNHQIKVQKKQNHMWHIGLNLFVTRQRLHWRQKQKKRVRGRICQCSRPKISLFGLFAPIKIFKKLKKMKSKKPFCLWDNYLELHRPLYTGSNWCLNRIWPCVAAYLSKKQLCSKQEKIRKWLFVTNVIVCD